jgi:hypothetical protein
MKIIHVKQVIGTVALLMIVMLASISIVRANQPVKLQNCAEIQVPAGNKLAFHAFARGVQIYRWNGTSWDFVAPVADLFGDPNYRGKVGIHYVGPTWESISGSRVVARKDRDCSPNPNAIPWLRLQTVSATGPGVFSQVTYIQRVNTTGGLPPNLPGQSVGMEARVPYTAEYFFFSAGN